MTATKRAIHLFIVLVTGFFLAFPSVQLPGGQPVKAAPVSCSGLFFSEYLESKVHDLALEIFNGTSSPIQLNGYSIDIYYDGAPNPATTIPLNGAVPSGGVYVVANDQAKNPIENRSNYLTGLLLYDGNDAIVLRNGSTIVDVIGQVGFDPGLEWGSGLTSTEAATLVRNSSITQGDANGADGFNPAVEWDGYPRNTITYLGSHVAACLDPTGDPLVTATTPVDGATRVPVDADLTVTFNEDVSVDLDWFVIECGQSGSHTAASTETTPGRFTLNPAADFQFGETCTVTVYAVRVHDADAYDPPDTPAQDYTFGFTVQDQAPDIVIITPAPSAVDVPLDEDLTVTFSEAVSISPGWLTIECTVSGSHDFTVAEISPSTEFTVDPLVDFVYGDSCATTVAAGLVADADTDDPPDGLAADFSWTFTTLSDQVPVVTATTPAGGATQIPTGADLTVTFSEDVRVDSNWFAIACSVSGSHAALSTETSPGMFTLNPVVDFDFTESCLVTIFANGVHDEDISDPPDTPVEDYTFGFTVQDQAPFVTATTPGDGAANVSVDANLTLDFSEPVYVASGWMTLACTRSGVHEVSVVETSPSTHFTVDPVVNLASGETCNATLTPDLVTDADSDDPPNQLAADFSWSFSTVPDPAPSVTSTSPSDGSAQIPADANLTIQFSEPVNVDAAWFSIACSLSGSHAASSTETSPGLFTLNPDADFQFGETCQVTIYAAQVHDSDAYDPPDTPAQDYTFGFTVRDQTPMVVSVTPASLEANVPVDEDLTITFNEAVYVSPGWLALACTRSGNHEFTVAETSPSTLFTVNPVVNFTYGDMCTVTLTPSLIADVDSDDPPDGLAAGYAWSFSAVPYLNLFFPIINR